MFINCPSCHGLVATDPATDLPPERCPRCAAQMRQAAAAEPASDARSGVAAAVAEAVGDIDAGGAPDPADDRAAQPAISIANLLQADTQPGLATLPAPLPPMHDATAVAEPEPEPESAPAPAPEPAPVPATRPRRAAPSFARPRRDAGAARGARRWPLPAAIAGLGLLLGLQWLLADRERLAADPAWRPLVRATCTVLRCSLPPWQEPGAFALLERDVRPHPEAADTLRITASFRNEAAWAQAWPEVVLTLSDLDGRPLGARAFTPAEYLGGAPTTPLVGPGEGAVIRMDVLEPGPGAVGFSFDFR